MEVNSKIVPSPVCAPISSIAKAAAVRALWISLIATLTYVARLSLRLHHTANLRFISQSERDVIQLPLPRVALVTMASPNFLNCSIQLFRAARNHGWRQPMILLAIDGEAFDSEAMEEITRLGVHVVHTAPALDDWVENMDVPRNYHYRKLSMTHFRKMEVFYNPLFRTFNRVVYMDPDGEIAAPLTPLELMDFPKNKWLLMRQNEATLGKPSMWKAEIAPEALKTTERILLESRYPDRTKVGASCWFIVEMAHLPPPRRLLDDSRNILCLFKAAFRFNDQTLMNLLFYDHLDIFPWCSSSELQVINRSNHLRLYCKTHMNDQRWMNGGLTFMYRHHAPIEKAMCRGSTTASESKGFQGVHFGNRLCSTSNNTWSWSKTTG